MQRAVFRYFARFVIPRKKLYVYHRTFFILNTSQSGSLTRNELIDQFYHYNMWDMTFKKLDAIMALVDLDNSGTIGFEEYLLTSVSPKDITAKAILLAAFKDFDVDGSRSLSIAEIRNRLQGE